MQIINPEFVQAVRQQLETIKPGFYLTREQVCVSLGVPPEYANVISILFQTGEFPEYETVRSRGIRRKKEAEVSVSV